jgi:hypothetical protein
MLVVSAMSLHPAFADTAAEIDRDVDSALQKLYASTPAAKELSKVAKGILVFPPKEFSSSLMWSRAA